MATTYIKLGPIGDAFSSQELGLYLLPGNASEIDDSIINNRLVNFFKTGFLVEISQLEYDNIKLLNQVTSNIPLNSVPVGQPNILEPVEDGVVLPPASYIIGKRYLVIGSVPGQFIARQDYIAQAIDNDWNYTKPENGMILPVYAWGISLHYTGTYPSGFWDIPAEKLIAALIDVGLSDDVDAKAYADNLMAAEILAREKGDKDLNDRIDNLNISIPPTPGAGDISIVDQGNYYNSTTIEGALQEIGNRLQLDEQAISNLVAQVNTLISNGAAAQFLFGPEAPTDDIGNWNDIYIATNYGSFWQRVGNLDESNWVLKYTIPGSSSEIIPYPIGSHPPLVLDMTTDERKVYGPQAKLGLWEKLTGDDESPARYKPAEGIYVEYQWDDEDMTNLLTITINPDADPTDGTGTPYQFVLTK